MRPPPDMHTHLAQGTPLGVLDPRRADPGGLRAPMYTVGELNRRSVVPDRVRLGYAHAYALTGMLPAFRCLLSRAFPDGQSRNESGYRGPGAASQGQHGGQGPAAFQEAWALSAGVGAGACGPRPPRRWALSAQPRITAW